MIMKFNRNTMTRALLIFCLTALLTGCGVGEFFIKRSVLKMESDIAKELKSYAKFSDEQKVGIDEIAAGIAQWTRGERLSLLNSHLMVIADEVERDARLSEDVWSDFVLFMEDPFTLSEAPGLLAKMSSVMHGMSDQQAQQATAKMVKDYKEKRAELDDITPENEVEKIVKGLKVVFKDLGIKRSREQLKTAQEMLMKRENYLELDKAKEEKSHQDFVGLMNDRSGDLSQFEARFREAWLEAEASPRQRVPDAWNKNLAISLETMNYLLEDLSQEQRVEAAKSIRDYATLFDELSRFE